METEGTYTAQGYFSGSRLAPSAISTAETTPNPPGTPSRYNPRNPFGDGIESHSSSHIAGTANPFVSPEASRPASSSDSSSGLGHQYSGPSSRYFQSRRVRTGEVEKPWLEKKDPKEKWVTILPLLGVLAGLAISGFLIYDGISSVVQHSYCLVLDDDFSGGLDGSIWTKEVQVGGFGNGEFEEATAGDENVYVDGGQLVIKATLQDSSLMEKDSIIDLLKDGTCTSTSFSDCVAATNTSAGNSSVVPPTRSGRITTKKGATIKYGRVEVTARLPKGDWLWPAIWMMPVNDTYGPWPSSGEIDIMESRGNNHTYPQGGDNIISSALHWGPDPTNDGWWRTNVKHSALHTTYSEKYHTFQLEWSEKYLFTSVNGRLLQVLYVNFDHKTMWERGHFPNLMTNGSRIVDTWSTSGRKNTPFDEPFYLILNVAVGGTNGWFQDGVAGKPWADGSENARKDFWNTRDEWYPSWTKPQMEVSRVVMYQQCDGGEDL